MPLVACYAASKCAVEGFTESLSWANSACSSIKARLVEPGLAPTSSFGANSGDAHAGMIPADYAAYAEAYFARMANYPTAYCSEQEVAEATFAAATDTSDAIRYPAGADTKMLAELRWTTSEEHYLATIRRLFAPELPVH